MNIPTNIPKQGPEIDLSETTAIKCDNCSNEVFIPGFMIRKVSAFVNPSGREVIIQIPVQVCSACSSVNQEFIPAELKNKIKAK